MKSIILSLLRIKRLSIQDLVHRSVTQRFIFDSLSFPVAGPLMVFARNLRSCDIFYSPSIKIDQIPIQIGMPREYVISKSKR